MQSTGVGIDYGIARVTIKVMTIVFHSRDQRRQMIDHIAHTGAAMFGRHLFAKEQRLGRVGINLDNVVARGPEFIVEANPSVY